jgi:predicted dehydrogenase
MSKLRFALIGDGAIAKYHKKAIEHVGGELIVICDPEKYLIGTIFNGEKKVIVSSEILYPIFYADYYVICSPSFYHREQIQYILDETKNDTKIICEKPAFLPWEPIIDSERVNIVLQLRYLPNLPKKADLVKAVFVRDEEYFRTWKGDARKTGGLFFNLFIHGIDLAIQLNADFEGRILTEGKQERTVWKNGECIFDISKEDTQYAYNRMYENILEGKGIKPKHIFYLNWILQRNSEIFGYGRNSMNKIIRIEKELL